MVKKMNRDYYFDNAKFLLIILVVLAHSLTPVKKDSFFLSSLYSLIFTFHMPCFVFISGYFMKYSKNASKQVVQFMKLYVIMQTLYFLVMNILGDGVELRYSTPYFTYWFLLSSSIWYMVFPYVKDIKGILPISFIIAILIGYDNGFGATFSFSRTIVFFPYFLLGYFTKRETLINIKNSYKKYIVLGTCALIALVFIGQGWNLDTFLHGKYSYDKLGFNEWYAGLYRGITYGISIIYGLGFFMLVPEKEAPYSKLGTQTLQVYLSHGIIIKVLKQNGFFNYIDSPATYALLIALAIGFTIVVSVLSLKFKDRKSIKVLS